MEVDKVIIKSKGLSNKLLNEDHFKSLLDRNNVKLDSIPL
jgi:hypothetical protein